MYRKILVPMALDHDLSPNTLAVAKALGEDGCEIIALHVHEDVEGSARAFLDEGAIEASMERAKATMAEKVSGMANVTPVFVGGHTARTIIDFANSNNVDCIVIGSHKPGLSGYFLGSTASRVVRHATSAVHVYRTAD